MLYFQQNTATSADQSSPEEPNKGSDDELANRPLADHLRDAIVEVYKQMLLFLSEARRFYHEGVKASNQDSNESTGQETGLENKAKICELFYNPRAPVKRPLTLEK